jgi:hypothetical protein
LVRSASEFVNRSTVVHICRVAKQGASDALAASVPGRPVGTSSPEQVEHVAARLTRGQRRLWLRIDRHWPWVTQLATAFARLAALPVPTV